MSYPTPSLYDTLRAAQCATHAWSKSIMTHQQFDELAKAYESIYEKLPPGSTDVADYTIPERNLALYFIARAHT